MKRITSAVDCETDPFKIGRTNINPFVFGIYDGSKFISFWGDDCVKQFMQYLASDDCPPMNMYAHNGGKFDWLFLRDYMDADIMFIGSRIVKATVCDGKHVLYDSYANMPVPLAKFVTGEGRKKQVFDYSKMERRTREKYKKPITDYLKDDCVVLYEAIIAWLEMFGDKSLTMASAATKLLKGGINDIGMKLESLSERQDEFYRKFYFGGRVECFESGILTPSEGKQWHVHDIHSSYPSTMAELEHPISNCVNHSYKITDKTDFAIITARSKGALPWRDEKGNIKFPHGVFKFYACGHEIRTALELGLLHIVCVHDAIEFTHRTNFKDFIDRFYKLRNAARASLNEMLVLFYKLVMNSSYGKTAIDPRKFKETVMIEIGSFPEGTLYNDPILDEIKDENIREKEWRKAWRPVEIVGDRMIWERNISTIGRFLNVACGASITSGSRAKLLRGLASSVRPVYCDTDSVISEEFSGNVTKDTLGTWGLEKIGDKIAVAGKKMYALFKEGQCIKKACKGVNISPEEICSVAEGNSVEYIAEAPIMNFNGKHAILRRTIRNTARIEQRNTA